MNKFLSRTLQTNKRGLSELNELFVKNDFLIFNYLRNKFFKGLVYLILKIVRLAKLLLCKENLINSEANYIEERVVVYIKIFQEISFILLLKSECMKSVN